MKKLFTNPTMPSPAPASSAGDFIHALIEMFSAPESSARFRTPALELDTILLLNPNAEHDLLDALFGDHQPDLTTPAGRERLMDTLKAVGAVEQRREPGNSHNARLKFQARPLVDLLKATPRLAPGNSREQLNSHIEITN
jgi:hypothetical protein